MHNAGLDVQVRGEVSPDYVGDQGLTGETQASGAGFGGRLGRVHGLMDATLNWGV
jgi:hypothetical protein